MLPPFGDRPRSLELVEVDGPAALRRRQTSSPVKIMRPLSAMIVQLLSKFGVLKRLPRTEMLAVMDQVLVSGASFIATVGIGRSAGPGELGAYSAGMSIVFALIGLQEALIILPYMIRCHRPTAEHSDELAGIALTQSVSIWGTASIVLMLGAAIAWTVNAGHGLPIDFLALAWLAPVFLAREFGRQISFSHLQVPQALALDAGAFACQTGALLGLGVLHRLTTATTYLGVGTALAAVSAYWFYRNLARFRLRKLQLRHMFRESWAIGKWLFGAQTAESALTITSSWLLIAIQDVTAAGVYAACLALVSVANPLLIGFSNLLMPRAASVLRQDGSGGLMRQAVNDALMLGLVLAVFCAFLAMSSDTLAHLLFSSTAYVGHAHVTLVLGIALLVRAIGTPASNALASMEKPFEIFQASCAAALANVFIGAVLIWYFGVLGAAFSVVIANLVGTCGRWAGFLHCLRDERILTHSYTDQARDVLQRSHALQNSRTWDIAFLGEGSHGAVFSAAAGNNPRDRFVVKVYRPMISLEFAEEQLRRLAGLHAALNGRRIHGWTLAVPAPVWLCEAPLALVMTGAHGRSILHHLETDGSRMASVMQSAASAIVAAMAPFWDQFESHGDFNLDNILCDHTTMTLSFLDPSHPGLTVEDSGPPNRCPSPCAHDLAYLLYESVVGLRRSVGRVGAETRKTLFTMEVLRAALNGVPSGQDKHRLLDEIQGSSLAYLRMLEPSCTPQGLWRGLLRLVGRHRIVAMIGSLRDELAGPGVTE
jgi:O-antigen/teichoic acid export membrane protein